MGTSRRANPINKRRKPWILAALQRDARLPNVELAEEVGLSLPPVCGGFVPWRGRPSFGVITRASTGLASVLA
ncbi:AsnC family transcriptional regulator [Agrobacterium larrymoorei]|uniref:AsnC family transcriptional regulator n=1 Tax=Agrobacterium larrymoorei TaxID=160699 RepID=UPI003593DEDC